MRRSNLDRTHAKCSRANRYCIWPLDHLACLCVSTGIRPYVNTYKSVLRQQHRPTRHNTRWKNTRRAHMHIDKHAIYYAGKANRIVRSRLKQQTCKCIVNRGPYIQNTNASCSCSSTHRRLSRPTNSQMSHMRTRFGARDSSNAKSYTLSPCGSCVSSAPLVSHIKSSAPPHPTASP